MARVEQALGRLDGVSQVSAGYRTNSAYLSAKTDTPVDMKQVNDALKASTSFSCLSLKRAD